MSTRTDIAGTLARAANPVEPDPARSAWADAEGQAAFERIMATPVPSAPSATRRPRVTRRRLAIGVALAAAAGAAVAVVGLPGSPNHGGTGAAWAVTKHPDGSLTVTIKNYRDPAGLQAKLREAGLPATVTPAPDWCVYDVPEHGHPWDQWASFNGAPETFRGPYTWQRLFAGSPYGIDEGPQRAGILHRVPGQHQTLPPGVHVRNGPEYFTFTVHPRALPPGDVINLGIAGRDAVVVDVEKAGTPLQCEPAR